MSANIVGKLKTESHISQDVLTVNIILDVVGLQVTQYKCTQQFGFVPSGSLTPWFHSLCVYSLSRFFQHLSTLCLLVYYTTQYLWFFNIGSSSLFTSIVLKLVLTLPIEAVGGCQQTTRDKVAPPVGERQPSYLKVYIPDVLLYT